MEVFEDNLQEFEKKSKESSLILLRGMLNVSGNEGIRTRLKR
jgi:hypothetical protein